MAPIYLILKSKGVANCTTETGVIARIIQNPSKTAVLIFALSPEEAKKRKHFLAKAGLSEKLTLATVQKVRSTGLDYMLFTEREQRGNTFAERFTQAVGAVFNLGYDHIITVGNDSPQLGARHIREAHVRLQKDQPTIGPSADGGFYLLAISKAQFCEKAYTAFSWQTNKVFRQVYDHVASISGQNAGTERIHCLPVFYDLDTVEQVKKLLALIGISKTTLVKWLQKLILVKGGPATVTKGFYFLYFLTRHYNKGSPNIFHSVFH